MNSKMVIPARLQKATIADRQLLDIRHQGCPACGDSNLKSVAGLAKEHIECNGSAHLYCIACQYLFYFGD